MYKRLRCINLKHICYANLSEFIYRIVNYEDGFKNLLVSYLSCTNNGMQSTGGRKTSIAGQSRVEIH